MPFLSFKHFSRQALVLFFTLGAITVAEAQFGSAQLIYNAGPGDIPERVAAADIDGDGDTDILTKEMFNNPIFWLSNDGQGNFTNTGIQLRESAIGEMQYIQTFDYDKDGDQDVVAAFESQIFLWENGGSGVFSSRRTLGSGFEYNRSVFIMDYDQDNDPDILVGSAFSSGSSWLQNNFPVKTWTQMPFAADILDATYFDAADMDNDGTTDLITMDAGTSSIKVNGNPIVTKLNIGYANFLKVADIDSDHDYDIIAGTLGYDDGLILLTNNGDGTFMPHIVENTADRDIRAIAVFDFDDDGDHDIFAGCWMDCGTALYENIGAGRFALKGNIGSGAIQKHELLAKDLDGDGRADLVKNDGGFHTVLWHRNTTIPFSGIEAGFIHSGSCQKDAIQFNHTVRGKNIASWSWDFGDGQTSADQNPSHYYAAPGSYEVSLTVTNSSGQSHTIKQTVQINPNPVLPDLDERYCTNNRYETRTVTLDPIYSYNWFFNSSSETPFHSGNTYTAEFYAGMEREVTATNEYGCTSERATLTAKPSPIPTPPYAEGNISYGGTGELRLAGQSITGTSIQWFTADAGEPFHKGSALTRVFSSTTTLFINAINEAGCESSKVPITATVHAGPLPPPSYVWADVLDTDKATEGRGMTRDNDGNFVVMGSWAEGSINAGGYTLNAGPEWKNRFIVTYDKNGVVRNALKLFSAKADWLEYDEILVDRIGNFYYTADVRGEYVLVGNQTITLPVNDEQLTLIIKTDPAGTLLWYKVYPYSLTASRIAIDQNNEVVVHGHFTNSITIDGETLNAYGQSGFVAKLQEDGQLSWIYTFPYISLSDLTVDHSNNIYLSGSMYDDILDFGGTAIHKNDKAASTAVVIKFASAGTFLKARDVLATDAVGQVSNIEIDHNNDLLIYGSFSGTTAINGYRMSGWSEIYLIKCNTDLEHIWARQFVGNGQEIPWDMAIDADNNIFLTGAYYGKLSLSGFNLSRNTAKLHYQFAARLSPDGVIEWARDADIYRFANCEADDEGGLFISGSLVRHATLDDIELFSATSVPDPVVNYNIFTAKLGFIFKSDFRIPGSVCRDSPVQFQDWSTVSTGASIVSWSWDFGDGGSSNEQHPSHTYANAGNYTVTLAARNSTAEVRSFSKQVTISSAISPSIIPSGSIFICDGEGIAVSGPVGFASYVWSDGFSERQRTISEAGEYRLKVANDYGCQSSFSEPVMATAHAGPSPVDIITPEGGLALCAGNSLALAVPEGYSTYEWSDGATGRLRIISRAGGYKVKVANAYGCWSSYSTAVTVTENITPSPVTLSADEPAPVLCPDETFELTVSGDYAAYEWSDGILTQSRTIGVAGEYSVKVANDQGCWSPYSNSLQVTQEPAPVPVVVETPAAGLTLCPGDKLTLIAPGGYASYEWNTGTTGHVNEVSTTGTYSVKVASTHGCWSDFSEPLTVTLISILPPEITAVNANLLEASEGASFSWLLDDIELNETGQQLDVSAPGSYTVEVTDVHGCVAKSEPYFVTITSIEKNSEDFGIRVHPNPTKTSVYLESEHLSIQHIMILDRLGRQLASIPGHHTELDFEAYPDGLYFIVAQTKAGLLTFKISKIK